MYFPGGRYRYLYNIAGKHHDADVRATRGAGRGNGILLLTCNYLVLLVLVLVLIMVPWYLALVLLLYLFKLGTTAYSSTVPHLQISNTCINTIPQAQQRF